MKTVQFELRVTWENRAGIFHFLIISLVLSISLAKLVSFSGNVVVDQWHWLSWISVTLMKKENLSREVIIEGDVRRAVLFSSISFDFFNQELFPKLIKRVKFLFVQNLNEEIWHQTIDRFFFEMLLAQVASCMYESFHVSHDRDCSICLDLVGHSFSYRSTLVAWKIFSFRCFMAILREALRSWPSEPVLLQPLFCNNGAVYQVDIFSEYGWVWDLGLRASTIFSPICSSLRLENTIQKWIFASFHDLFSPTEPGFERPDYMEFEGTSVIYSFQE